MKKSSIILSILTLTAALASLPALGDLNFLKRDYTYLEKIPVKSVSSYTDGFTYDSNQKQTGNVLGDNKETQWISWKNNVIWEEDYSTDRYFTETIIDGSNGTKPTSGNNVLTVAPKAGGDWRQHKILWDDDNLKNLKAGTYTVKMRYRGDVAAASAGNLYFGSGADKPEFTSPILDVTTTWKEADYKFEITEDINDAYCAIQPGGYSGTFDVDWVELTNEAHDGTPYTFKVDFDDEYNGKTIFNPDPDNTKLNNGLRTANQYLENGVLISEPILNAQGDNVWYQFRVLNDLHLEPSATYTVTLNIKGNIEGATTRTEIQWWFGGGVGSNTEYDCNSDGNTLAYTGVFSNQHIKLQTPANLDVNYPQVFTLQPAGNRDIIEIKSVTIQKEGSADPIIYNFANFQNWPFKNGDEYIPALVEENGKVVARITGSNLKNSDRFRFATNMNLVSDSYKLKAMIKASVNSGENEVKPLKLIIGTGGIDTRGTVSIDLKASDDYVEYIVPVEPFAMQNGETNDPLPARNDYWLVYDVNNYGYDFSVESFELISDSDNPATTSVTVRNDGDQIGDMNINQRKIVTIEENGTENSIIRSYPLPTTRKVIVATGNSDHTNEQYLNKEGFNLETNHVYTVFYNITSDRAATVKTMLASSQVLTNGSVWDESQAIGISDTIQLLQGVTREVRTNISTSSTTGAYNNDGAVVLDLGYDLGRVEVTDLKIVDNYDSSIQERNAQIGDTQTQANEKRETGKMDAQQVQLMSGLTLNDSETYTVTVRMKATKPGRLCLKLGNWFGDNRMLRYKNFNASSDWQTVTFTVKKGEGTNDKEYLNYNKEGSLILQLQTPNGLPDSDTISNGSDTYDGIVTVQLVKITSSTWVDDKSQEVALNYANGDKYTGKTFSNSKYPKVDNGKLVFDEINGVDDKFIVKSGLGYIDQAKTYKIYLKSKGTNDTQFRVLFGSDGANAVGFVGVAASSDSFTEKEAILNDGMGQYNTIAQNSVLQLQTQGTIGRVEIESIRVAPNANEHVAWFTNGSGSAVPLNGYNDIQISDNGLQLNVQSKPLTCEVINNLDLTPNKSYSVDFEIQAAAGRYIVALGDGTTSLTREIEITEKEANTYVKKHVNFGSNASESGSLTISPVGYTANLNVKNAQIMEYTPGFKQGDMIGTDFFEVELGDVKVNTPYMLDKEGKYVFHIGYVTDGNDTPAAETPKSIMIAASNSKDGNYTRLGLCELIDMKNGNAFFSTVNSPLKNIEDNYRYLRIYCVDNMGEQTAICFPKENEIYNQDNAYIGNMLRMTRFGIYKQSTMFATDKASVGTAEDEATFEKYTKWAMPMLTRFQIEALGKKYAYPGATLHDMIGVDKRTEVCGELFDKDAPRVTYWDTTLPFLKDMNRGDGSDDYQDIHQYIDYTKFTYPDEYDGNRNYDCIDLLLPKFEDLGAVKKLNGKVDENGIYQLVVSMKRSTGTIDDYNNRIIYDDETAEFKNRANGFPIEISYKGLKLDENHTKTPIEIDKTERVLTFPTVAAGDSIQFALKIEPGWNGVRIFCRENTGNLQRRPGGTKATNAAATQDRGVRVVDVINNTPGDNVDLSNTRILRLGEIRAYVEMNKINLETSPEQYDLLYNYREDFNTRSWAHNQGIIADINNLNTVNGSTGDQYMAKGDGGQTWKDVIDTYKDFFDEQGIAYPDFSLITNPFNDEEVVPSNGNKRTKKDYNGQNRQRSYTILHEVMALPGERVDLYPQSDIWQPDGFNYEEQFVRWYDYLTDKAPDYLYFFAEPKSVIKTDNAGFIGGMTLLDHGLRGKGTVASIYYNDAERLAFAEKVKDNPKEQSDLYYLDDTYKDKDGNPVVRIKDNWVAADFSLAFNTNLAERLGKDVKSWENKESSIQEPIINFRHLFHITSGSLFADRYMSTAEGNQHYAKSNRRYISTFADKTFKIRLEQAMPVDENTKSPFYYKTDDGLYIRVRGYDIRTYKLEDGQTSDDLVATINNPGDHGGNADMFVIDKSSTFDHIDSYVQTTTDPSRWLRNSKKFARSIVCSKGNAHKGRYLVRLYGKDESGNVIGLKSSESGNIETKPLVIAEYEVEFMGEEYASFKSEEFLKNLTGENYNTYGHHTEDYLEEHYGNGKSDAKAVNFDKYMILNSESVIVNKGAAPVDLKRFGFFEDATPGFLGSDKTGTHVEYVLNDKVSRMKMPITWGNSNYGFGYQISGDYNMFRLASHSLMTPYMSAASTRGVDLETDVVVNETTTHKMVGETLTWVDEEGETHEKTGVQGTYDRLYYNTHGEQQGLFYYVNAAADPGEMVKIDFDYLCPGSTIYVSAWVNEFNHAQPETANVIFNFYANVAKTDEETGEKMIIRQEQIHGFATGYVNRNQYGFDESDERTGGDQGKWMHVYYSFVPDETHADIVKSDGEYIDSYYLVLENNCLSSEGADYAIDDIRAYVVAPRVEARQSNSLCEKNDVNIDIQVELPLEALEESLADLVDKDGKVTLQYSIVDKTVYDNVLKEKEEAFNKTQENEEIKKEYEPSSEDCREAFVAGVLHYKHKNIMSDDHKDKDGNSDVDYPISWGEIEFYMDYNNKKYKNDDGSDNDDAPITGSDGNTRLKINGEYLTLGEYKEKYLQDIFEKCFVFTTHPVSDDSSYNDDFIKTHRDYYVVVGNFETKGLFTSITEDQKDKYNADVYPFNLSDGKYSKSESWEKYDDDLAMAYQIGSDCARMAAFSLKGSAQIVIDGVLHETDDNITCCENQRPVVQLNLKTRKENKAGQVLANDLELFNGSEYSENPYLDWWTGQFEDFAETHKVIDGKDTDLWDVLDDFRNEYPKAETWDMPCTQKYTQAKKDWLQVLCSTTTVNDEGETVPVEPKLILHMSSYVFPQSKTVLLDANGKKVKTKEIYVTAIPPATPTEIVEKNEETGKETTYVICTQPREVKITVSNTSPTLFNGFNEITYPEDIEDVPLRIGLKQLDKVNTGESGNKLFVPLRNVNPATYDVKEFVPFGNEKFGVDKNIYLVETNDPNYRKLSDNDKLDEKAPSDTYDVETRVVGEITNLLVKFKKEEDVVTLEGTPIAQVVFDPWTQGTVDKGKKLDRGITFREGYYYKFKFNFMEGETSMSGQEGYEMPCNGQTVFSIKVVPEYQIWTGDSSLNWNNDDNWRRVELSELLATGSAPNAKGSDGRFTTDGKETKDDKTVFVNANDHSYAPMNFTKVIIPAGTTYPQLAPRRHSYGSEGALEGADSELINNGKKSESYIWTNNSPKAVTAAGANKESSLWNASAASSYDPTVYINYDMAATTYSQDDNVFCRPWYANACDEIHFNTNAEILNQQNLDYNKAWVDMEMTPHRWYNVASPLYGVVAGDMYLPSVGTDTPGRQMTELFAPITYNNEDKTKNDRFAPAVYQRGWDKGTEKVYTVHNDVKNETESVALASTWSHVYNDVTEEYAPGMGYSVKTDVTRLTKFGEDYEGNDKQTLVKFRFPKADEGYNYFDDDNTAPGEKNHRDLTREKAGKLFEMSGETQEIILEKANDGKLFLVGNPFMAHLDMAKFLAANSEVIAQKYWILSEGQGQVGVVMDHENYEEILSNDKWSLVENNYERLAPMQGFFVQALDGKVEQQEGKYILPVKFKPDMMAVQPYSDATGAPILKAPAYGTRVDGEDIIRVSTEESTAIIRLSAAADKGYAASEDVEMIDDSNQRGIRRIYTVAGTMASAINQTPDADGVEVGLMAPTDSLTVVTFNGLALEDYLLYDTATGEMTQLYDGFELEMEGSVSGRYFLTAGIDTAEIEDGTIRIMPVGREAVVTAPAVCGEMTVRVFDTLGREVAKAEGMEGEVRIALDPGIYAVEAVGADAGRKSTKIQIR